MQNIGLLKRLYLLSMLVKCICSLSIGILLIPKLIEFATPQTLIDFCSQALGFTTLTTSTCYILFLISRIYRGELYNHTLTTFVFFIH